MNLETKKRVFEHIFRAMKRKIDNQTLVNPFDESTLLRNNPFGARLVPPEVWKGSKFERSFVTTLGQGIFEQIGLIIAEGTGATAVNQHRKSIQLNTFQFDTIDRIVNRQATSKKSEIVSDIGVELRSIRDLETDSQINVNVISDLYIKRSDGREEFYSFKTVKPNKDQTAAAKKNLLYLRTENTNNHAFFALPYNPAGEGHLYLSQSHKIPGKFFDMEDTNYVLIGSSLWNKIGDDDNTYKELLQIFEEVGKYSSERIKKEYFGL